MTKYLIHSWNNLKDRIYKVCEVILDAILLKVRLKNGLKSVLKFWVVSVAPWNVGRFGSWRPNGWNGGWAEFGPFYKRDQEKFWDFFGLWFLGVVELFVYNLAIWRKIFRLKCDGMEFHSCRYIMTFAGQMWSITNLASLFLCPFSVILV